MIFLFGLCLQLNGASFICCHVANRGRPSQRLAAVGWAGCRAEVESALDQSIHRQTEGDSPVRMQMQTQLLFFYFPCLLSDSQMTSLCMCVCTSCFHNETANITYWEGCAFCFSASSSLILIQLKLKRNSPKNIITTSH